MPEIVGSVARTRNNMATRPWLHMASIKCPHGDYRQVPQTQARRTLAKTAAGPLRGLLVRLLEDQVGAPTGLHPHVPVHATDGSEVLVPGVWHTNNPNPPSATTPRHRSLHAMPVVGVSLDTHPFHPPQFTTWHWVHSRLTWRCCLVAQVLPPAGRVLDGPF